MDLAAASRAPAAFLGVAAEYGNHMLTSRTRFEQNFILESHNGLIIGGASSTVFSCLITARALLTAFSKITGLEEAYAFADDINPLIQNANNAGTTVDIINAELQRFGLMCPPSSFTIHLPFYRGTKRSARSST